jgi:glycosyltransferase involved in cell wall biosynthesis
LFDPEHEASFTEQLCQLCGNAPLRRQLGIAALQTLDSKKLYWQENASRIENLLKAINT